MGIQPMTQTTTFQALVNLLKAYVGSGILSMPKAFSYSGYIIGLFGTAAIGFLCNCSIHMLVEINKLHMISPNQAPYDYEQLSQIAFEYGPKRWRKYAKISRTFLTFSLCLTQLGFCCAYALFIGKNLLQFFINTKIGNFNEDDTWKFIFLLLPFMILLNFVKDIKHLSWASATAILVQLTSLSIIVYNLVQDVPKIEERKAFYNEIPQFISTTVFTFEGITVTMPLYRSMKNRENFSKTFGVINMAIIFVITIYCSIGFLGYLKYGDDVAASITLSLPNEPLYEAVQLMYSFAITFSYPLQMYVAIQIVWPPIRNFLENRKKSERFINITDYVCRAVLVTITFILAASIPELDLVIELIGAFSCASVALIIPPIIHLVSFTERRKGLSKFWLYLKDLTTLGVGLFAFIAGTYFALQGMVQRMGKHQIPLIPGNSTSSIFFNHNDSTSNPFQSIGSILFGKHLNNLTFSDHLYLNNNININNTETFRNFTTRTFN